MAMIECRYTLVAEGSSDALLLHIIDWLWAQWPGIAATGSFFNPTGVAASTRSLHDKIRCALRCFPCRVLFVHRDADNRDAEERENEIREAMRDIDHGCTVCVIPVRTTEAWLFSDQSAIRAAAGNPNGSGSIRLPSPATWEAEPNPKGVLFQALRDACGLKGRRLKNFSPERARARIAELTADFSPLRSLPAFRSLESRMRQVAADLQRGGLGG